MVFNYIHLFIKKKIVKVDEYHTCIQILCLGRKFHEIKNFLITHTMMVTASNRDFGL